MNRLKEREQKILDFMKKEIKTKGYPPTVREICTALGVKSTSTVHKDITEKLKKQNRALYLQVKTVLDKNKSERHLRGGEATKQKYLGGK